jgi:hypothetical protein
MSNYKPKGNLRMGCRFRAGCSELPSPKEFRLRSRVIRISGTTEESVLMNCISDMSISHTKISWRNGPRFDSKYCDRIRKPVDF